MQPSRKESLMKIFIGPLAAGTLLLTACSTNPISTITTPLNQLTTADLQAAAQKAGTADPAGAACWSQLASILSPTSTPNAEGVATAAERFRLLYQSASSNCSSLIAEFVLMQAGGLPSLVPAL